MRTVAADIVAFHTMINWATKSRDRRGAPLVDYSPLRGVKLPTEKNPKRPVETFERYVKIMEVAGEIDCRLPLVITLAESTGRRIGAILKLRREDVDLDRLPHGWLRFRAQHDKTGHEQWLPVTQAARGLLLAHLQVLGESELLFPGERKQSRPVCVSVMSRRSREAYTTQGLNPWKEDSGTPGGANGLRSARKCR